MAYARDDENGFGHQFLADRFRTRKSFEESVCLVVVYLPQHNPELYPWGLSVNVYMPIPGKPDKTLFLWLQYALDEEKVRHRNSTWLSDQVDAEDIEAISFVSKGAKSGLRPEDGLLQRKKQDPTGSTDSSTRLFSTVGQNSRLSESRRCSENSCHAPIPRDWENSTRQTGRPRERRNASRIDPAIREIVHHLTTRVQDILIL